MRYTPSPSLSDEHNGDITSRSAHRGHESSDERAEAAAEDSIYDARLRWPRPAGPQGASAFANNRFASKRPPLAKRILHASARFFLAVLIGVAATLSWQAYGDQAQKMVVTWIPSLAWLLPLSPTTSNNKAIASSPDLAQQLNPMALDIVAIQRQVAQLAANQGQLTADEGQIARSIAALQAAEQDVSEKISSLAEPKPVHVQVRRPAQRIAPSSVPPEPQ